MDDGLVKFLDFDLSCVLLAFDSLHRPDKMALDVLMRDLSAHDLQVTVLCCNRPRLFCPPFKSQRDDTSSTSHPAYPRVYTTTMAA